MTRLRRSGRDVTLQRVNGELLLVDDCPDDVADRDDANQPSLFHHWQMPDAFFGHQRHALLRRPTRFDADDPSRHDLTDERLPGRLANKDHLPRVIPLREDALDLL